jgi:hypothetical protein
MIYMTGLQVTENGSAVPNSDDDVVRDDVVRDEEAESSEPDAPPVSTPVVAEDEDAPITRTTSSRQVSLSIRTLVTSLVIAVLVAAVGVMTWLYLGEHDKVTAQQKQVSDYQHAEQLALDYAVNAATMNFQELNTWKTKLVDGTTPALNDKLTKAATSMEQILVPLEWNSTAQPLVAKVRSDTNGIYVIDTFVSVLTKTTQAPDNLQSTATYSITIDSNDNWQISDVGGIGAVAGAK